MLSCILNETQSEDGLFTSPNTIRISPASDNALESLAHEYMHYHWSTLTMAQRQPIQAVLLNFYETDRGFHAFFDGMATQAPTLAKLIIWSTSLTRLSVLSSRPAQRQPQ